jgi:peptide/nickel transport system permease protein
MQMLFLLTVVGVLIANLVADLLYGWLDPRVRRGG